MTGRHAAVPDESFDRQERETAGVHRADPTDPQGILGDGAVPADADLRATDEASAPPAKRARRR